MRYEPQPPGIRGKYFRLCPICPSAALKGIELTTRYFGESTTIKKFSRLPVADGHEYRVFKSIQILCRARSRKPYISSEIAGLAGHDIDGLNLTSLIPRSTPTQTTAE